MLSGGRIPGDVCEYAGNDNDDDECDDWDDWDDEDDGDDDDNEWRFTTCVHTRICVCVRVLAHRVCVCVYVRVLSGEIESSEFIHLCIYLMHNGRPWEWEGFVGGGGGHLVVNR